MPAATIQPHLARNGSVRTPNFPMVEVSDVMLTACSPFDSMPAFYDMHVMKMPYANFDSPGAVMSGGKWWAAAGCTDGVMTSLPSKHVLWYSVPPS